MLTFGVGLVLGSPSGGREDKKEQAHLSISPSPHHSGERSPQDLITLCEAPLANIIALMSLY